MSVIEDRQEGEAPAAATPPATTRRETESPPSPSQIPTLTIPSPAISPGPMQAHSLPPSPLSDTNIEEDITVDDSVQETSNKTQQFKVRHRDLQKKNKDEV